MLTHIGLKNFKAFREMSPLELKPITVLVGANSSGKSSIIHALLLLKQTLEGRRNRPLSLNGEFLSFSRYDEIVFGKQKDGLVTFDLECAIPSLPASMKRSRLRAFFSAAEIDTILGADEQNKLRVACEITFGTLQQENRQRVVLHSLEMSAVLGGMKPRRAELTLKAGKNGHAGIIRIPNEAGTILSQSIHNIDWTYFLPEKGKVDRKNAELDLFAIPDLQSELTERLHYVGPLRSEPRRAYFLLGDRVELDYRGEYTAQILSLEQDEPVDYLIDDQFQEKSIGLLEAVNHTLEMMGLPQSITPISREGDVSQLMLPLIGDDSQSVTIVDVGFGVSQLLPIIVAGLRANRGDTLIFEQPETHLHPKIQEALADFFILLHRLGKRVIVETHSDHLINGLRVRIAADQTDTLKDDVQIAFVRIPTTKGEGSLIEPLQFDEYGMIINWPPEFMSDGMKQMQEILRLGVEKRRKTRGAK